MRYAAPAFSDSAMNVPSRLRGQPISGGIRSTHHPSLVLCRNDGWCQARPNDTQAYQRSQDSSRADPWPGRKGERSALKLSGTYSCSRCSHRGSAPHTHRRHAKDEQAVAPAAAKGSRVPRSHQAVPNLQSIEAVARGRGIPGKSEARQALTRPGPANPSRGG